MTQRGFPLNDADVSVAEWSAMARYWMPTGVLPNVLNQLEVFADDSGRQVKIRTGAAFLRGHYYDNDAVVTKALSANNSGNSRRDLVTVRLNTGVSPGTIELYVIEGTPSADPQTPPTVDSSTVLDLPLGYATVANGATSIAAGAVTDLRSSWARPRGASVHAKLSTAGGVIGQGVGSVSNPATGRFVLTWTNAFADANYTVVATAQGTTALIAVLHEGSVATTGCELRVYDAAGSLAAPNWLMVSAWPAGY